MHHFFTAPRALGAGWGGGGGGGEGEEMCPSYLYNYFIVTEK